MKGLRVENERVQGVVLCWQGTHESAEKAQARNLKKDVKELTQAGGVDFWFQASLKTEQSGSRDVV